MAHIYSVILQADTSKVEAALEKALKKSGKVKGSADFSQVKSELEKIKQEFANLKLDNIKIQQIDSRPIQELKQAFDGINEAIGKINSTQPSFVWVSNLKGQIEDLQNSFANLAELKKQIAGNSKSDSAGKQLNPLSNAYAKAKTVLEQGSFASYSANGKNAKTMVSDIKQMSDESTKLETSINNAFKSLGSLKAPQLTNLLKDLVTYQDLLERTDDAISRLYEKAPKIASSLGEMNIDPTASTKQLEQALKKSAQVYSTLSKGQDINNAINQVENVDSPLKTVKIPLNITISLENIEAQVLHAVNRAEQIVKNREITLNVKAKKIQISSNIDSAKSQIKTGLDEIKSYFKELDGKAFRLPEITNVENLKNVTSMIKFLKTQQKAAETATAATQEVTTGDSKKKNGSKTADSTKTTATSKKTSANVYSGKAVNILDAGEASQNLLELKTAIEELNKMTIQPKGLENLKLIADDSKTAKAALEYISKKSMSNESKTATTTSKSSSAKTQEESLASGTKEIQLNAEQIQTVFATLSSTLSTGVGEKFVKLVDELKAGFTDINKSFSSFNFTQFSTDIQNVTNSLTALVNLLKTASDDQLASSWKDVQSAFNNLTDGDTLKSLRGSNNLNSQIGKDKNNFVALYNQYLAMGGSNRLENLTYASGTALSKKDLKKTYSFYNNTSAKNNVTNMSALQGGAVNLQRISSYIQGVNSANQQISASDAGWEAWLETLNQIRDALESISGTLIGVTVKAKEVSTSAKVPTNQAVVGEQSQTGVNGRSVQSITRKLDSDIDKTLSLRAKTNSDFGAEGKIDAYYENMYSTWERLGVLQTRFSEKRGLSVLNENDIAEIKLYEHQLKSLETELRQLYKTSYDSTNTKGTLITGTEDIDNIEKLENYVRKTIVGENNLVKSLTVSEDKNSISGTFEDAEGKLVSFKAALQSINGENVGVRLAQSFKTVEKSIEQAKDKANSFKNDNRYGKVMAGSEKVNNKGAMLSYLRKNLIGDNEVIKDFEVVGNNTVKGSFKDAENNIISYTATLNQLGTTGEKAGIRIKTSMKMASETVEEANAKLKQNLDNKYGEVAQGSEGINNTTDMLSFLRTNYLKGKELTKGLTVDESAGTVTGQIKQADGTLENFKATLDAVGVAGENVGVRIKSSFKTVEDSVTQAKRKTEQAKLLDKNDTKSSLIDRFLSNNDGVGKTSVYKQATAEIAQKYEKINIATMQLQNKDFISEEDNAQLKQYNQQLDELVSKIKKLSSNTYDLNNKKGLLQAGTEHVASADDLKKYILSNDFLNGGSLISAEYREKGGLDADEIVGKMRTIDGEVKKFKASIDSVNNGVRVLYTNQISAGATGLQRFGTALGSLNKQLLAFVGTYRIANTLFNNLRQGFSFAKEMDSALTTMSLTMDVTSSQLTSMGEASIQMAQDLGASVDSVTSVAQIYANMNETTESILASTKPTLYLTNATGMDTSSSANIIQGVVQQYKELEGQELHIVDALETVSASMKMDFALGIESMSDALERSGSIAREAGISFEELIGLAGKVTEVTRQSGEVTGSSLKTIFARLGRVTDDSEDALSASEVSNIAKAYNSVGISVYNADGSFVDATETLGKLADVWDTLTDAQRSYIAEQSAGVRQKNTFLIMMDNYEEAMELANQAENSDGFAEGVQEKYADSMEAKLNTLKSTWQETMYGIFDGDEAKAIISFLTTLLSLFNKLAGVKVVGALSIFSGIFGGVLSAKGGGLLNYDAGGYLKGNSSWKEGFSGIWSNFTSTPTAKKNKEMYSNVMAVYNANLTNNNGTAYLDAIDTLTKNMTQGKSTMNDYLKSLDGGVATFDGLAQAANKAGVSLGTLSTKQKLAAKAGSFLSTLGSSLMSAGISIGINLLITGLDKLIVTEKEAAEAAQEAQSAINESTSKYTDAKKSVNEYLDTYTRLGDGVKIVGNEIQNISLTDDEYNEFLEANNALAETFPDIVAGTDAEGNSLLTLSTNATTATASLEALLEVYKQMQVDTIKENWEDLYVGAEKATKDYEIDRAKASGKKGTMAAIAGTGYVVDKNSRQKIGGRHGDTVTYAAGDYMGETGVKAQEFFEKALEKYGGEKGRVTTDYGEAYVYIFDFEGEEAIEAFNSELDEATNVQQKYAEASADVASAQDKIDAEWKTMISTLSTLMTNQSGFSSLSENMQNGIVNFISSMSSDQIQAIGRSEEELQAWVDNVYFRFTGHEELYTRLFDLEALKEQGNLTVKEYLAQRDKIIKMIANAEGRSTEDVEIELGFKIKNDDGDIEDTLEQEIDKVAKNLGDKGSTITKEDLENLSYEDFQIAYTLVNEGETFDDVQDMIDTIKNERITVSVTTSIEDIQSLNDIITEAAGDTGLTSDSITSLKSMYADLFGDDGEKVYDALEYTSQGIRLNTDEILALQEAQETVTKSNYMRQLNNLNSKYNEASKAVKALNGETNETGKSLSQLQRQGDVNWWKTRADNLFDQIKTLRQAAAQFDGATSGWAKYQNALSTPNQGATYEGAYTAIDNVKKLYDNGDVGTDDFKTYVSMMTGISTSAPVEQIVQKYESSRSTIARYFTENAQGVVNFIDDLDKLDDSIVTVQKDASGNIINFDIADDQQAADALGISLEALQMILYELRDKGWDVDIDDSTFLEKM